MADSRFEKLNQKVYRLKFDIYNEIMETEMQMCKLTDEHLGDVTSKKANEVQNKSLLAKMNTLKK